MPYFTNRGITALAVAYQGPGDIATAANWKAWVGMRAFSATTAATPTLAVQVFFTDTTTKDYSTKTDGSGTIDFDTLIGDIAARGGGTPLLNIWYDQTGNGNHFTPGIRPVLSIGALGSAHAALFNGTTQFLMSTNTFTQSQPFSYSMIVKRTGSATQQNFADASTTFNLQAGSFNDPPIKWYTYAGGAGSEDNISTPTDNAFHAGQFIFATTSSNTYVDGVDSLHGTSIGSAVFTGQTISIGRAQVANFLEGSIVEFGFYAGSLSSFRSALNANQHSNNAYGTW